MEGMDLLLTTLLTSITGLLLILCITWRWDTQLWRWLSKCSAIVALVLKNIHKVAHILLLILLI